MLHYFKLLRLFVIISIVVVLLYILKRISESSFPTPNVIIHAQRNNKNQLPITKTKVLVLENVIEHAEDKFKLESNSPIINQLQNSEAKIHEEEPQFSEENIIFIESRCALNSTSNVTVGLDLNKRQACSIESAAKMNPSAKVYILYTCLFTGSLEDSSAYVIQLFTYPNVKIWKINIPEFLNGTRLQDWNFVVQLSLSKWPVEHSSDVLRFLSLLKYGGTYLDLDVVVTKSLEELGSNYVVKEDSNYLAASVLNFGLEEPGRMFAEICVEEIDLNFDGSHWTANGPSLVTKVFKNVCGTDKIQEMESERCGGMEILSSNAFLPIHYSRWATLYSPEIDDTEMNFEASYGVHMWNNLGKSTKINLLVPIPYGKLAQQFCPNVYSHSGNHL